MFPKQRALSPRSLIALFVAVTVVPLVALLWLGWQLLDRDRVLEEQRAGDHLELAADLVVAALESVLKSSEQRLADGATDWPEGSVALVLSKDHAEAFPKGRVAYLPVVSRLPEAPAIAFSAGDDLEFRRQDRSAAIEFFRPLANSSDAAIRAAALNRLGRNLAKVGRIDEALSAYKKMVSLDHVAIAGAPAGLVGRWARCDLLEREGRSAEHKKEVEDLASELQASRWDLPGDLYGLYAGDVTRWSGGDPAGVNESELFAEAAAGIWNSWQTSPNPGRETIPLKDQELIALLQGSKESVSVLIVTPQFVESEWLAAVESVEREHAVTLQLNARDSLGGATATKRLSKQTELPWDLTIASDDPTFGEDTRLRRRLLFAGFILLVSMAFAAGYLILRAVRRELAVSRFQSDFVAAVSHEFRTPLTTLRQFTDMLRDKERFAPDEGKERRLLSYDAQSRATARLTRLVESLLDFGRVEAGAYRYKFERRDCTALVSHVVEDFRLTAEAAGYELRFRGTGAPMIEADADALGRALLNLLDNAVKYSPDRHTIEVDVRQIGEEVFIDVRDQGIGVPIQERRTIFAKFQRGEQARKRGIKGTGIGLAMVDEIVRAHRGRIVLKSEQDNGSTFTIVLPVHPGTPSSAEE